MKAYRYIVVVAGLLGAAILVGFSGCRNKVDPGRADVVKIVSSLPRTGSGKVQSDGVVNGIKLALEEADYKVGKFTIEYADWDDSTAAAGQWTAEAETTNAEKAVRDPEVMIYIGTLNSGAAKVAMPILNRANLLMVSPANTAPGLTKPGKGEPNEPATYRPSGSVNFVRIVPADDLQGPLGAEWAKDLGAKKIYVLDDNEVYGKGISQLFREQCQELKLDVVGYDSIDPTSQEFRSLMAKVKGKSPDLVYFAGTSQSKGGQVANDLFASGLKCNLMVPDGCMDDTFIKGAGADNLEGRCYVTFGGLPSQYLKGAGKVFVDKYQKKYGGSPEAYAIYGYEAAKVALESLRRADKKDRDSIRKECLAIRDFDKGALGRWSFDANGDTTLRTMSGNVVRAGKFEFVKLLGE